MLKRGFYDLFTGISFVLVVAISILISQVTSSRLTDGSTGNVANALLVFQLVIGAIIFIYWVFTLILSINLYEKESISIVEVILSAVLIPFSPIIYLVLLRKPLKDYHEDHPHGSTKIGNVPGTP
jgi:hypothetical protein